MTASWPAIGRPSRAPQRSFLGASARRLNGQYAATSSLYEGLLVYQKEGAGGAPVFARQGSGYTWSLYKRANGRWHVDFNDVSEDWSGTIAYTTAAAAWPWEATWNGTAIAFRACHPGGV